MFAGAGMWLRALVDQVLVGECALPYSPAEFLVAASDNQRRELIVLVDNRFDQRRSPLQHQYFDFYAYGGLFRSVFLQPVSEYWLERVLITPLDLHGRVRLRVCVAAEHPAAVPETLRIAFRFDEGDVQVKFASLARTDRFASAEFDAVVPNVKLWSPDAPHLHVLALWATAQPDVAEQAQRDVAEQEASEQGVAALPLFATTVEHGRYVVERFGVRTIETRGEQILLNGSELRLRGYNRHESHPQFGPALPLAQLIADLQLLRDLGCNCVRGAHYSQDQRFLELCDELGFVVWEESLGWQQTEAQLLDERFMQLQVEQTERMVLTSFNHPSVVFWGFLNEGASHLRSTCAAYQRLFTAIRALDTSRLVTYASNHIFDDLNLALADVISVNCYPGWYAESAHARPLDEIDEYLLRLRQSLDQRGFQKPTLISEIGAGGIYGFRDPHRAHWSEEYQADLLERVCQLVLPDPRIAGLLLWQMHDMRTYNNALSLFRPRAFNNKGTLDEYRRAKLAYATVKRYFHADPSLKPVNPLRGEKQ
jgi:beta-glucuronidase